MSDVKHTPIVAEFVKCLGAMSHSRAGWDFQLSPAQKAIESGQEREALARARAIWSDNSELHDELRAAFSATSPLATISEIEAEPAQ